ncbi:Leucine--tRNA ligase [uncultured archaeon]|nr:Leucine--tRNA ligase [uncultured archaeon]
MQETDAIWQEKWEKARLFQPDAGKGGKFFLTPAFPYPNSPQHIGHGRTYTTTDIYARYMRMKGRNVLFPMGFHVTGTPILAMAKRIAEKDPEIIGIFDKVYGIPLSATEKLTDPKELVAYFSKEIEQGMKEMGYSIDWRRKFYSYDPQFNKFIRWHFAKLKAAGYIKKGEHPVPWCPVSQAAVGAHDTKGDIDPQIEEVTGVLFPFEDGFLACETYRPETIYGVTNIWLNPGATYVRVSDGRRKYYVAKDAAGSLSMQLPLSVEAEFSAGELMKKKAKNPLTGAELPLFPATFVGPKAGTGVVMSVPAHAPYDYLALRDANLLSSVPLVQVLKLEGFGKFPAQELVERMGVKSQDDPKAEEATSELYKKEAHTGTMIIGEFSGMKGVEAKEKIRAKMLKDGTALQLYDIQNGPIYSRYGGLVGVKIVKDQWFIDYGDEKWKALARKCLSQMRILPEKTRKEYEYTIGWLKEKACTRSSGLGTRFPFDETKMIEALSDSTIYMAFYTVSHIAMKMKPEELTEALFDFVFLGKGNLKALPKEAEEMQKSFAYWYPLDSRHSATDLVHNHLTFFIFNHAAIFQQEYWPRQIVANGFVLMDGKKMSKSMGNILPIRAAIKEFGADAIRFVVVSGADLAQDTDFNRPAVDGVLSRLKFMRAAMEKYAAGRDEGEQDLADRWILSRMHKRALAAELMYNNFQLRELSLELFYNTVNDLQWYLKRASKPKLREFFELWVPLIAPLIPHAAEEMWHSLGSKHYVKDAPFVSVAQLPSGDREKVNSQLELAEEYILRVKEDVQSILKLVKMEKPSKIDLFVASGWKRKLRQIAATERKFDTAMKKAMADAEIKSHGADAAKALASYMKNAGSLGETPSAEFELEALGSAVKLLEEEFGASISYCMEEETAIPKAKNALPGKPSILVS